MRPSETSYKLIHVVTVPGTLGFFRGQLDYIRRRGFDVSVVASPGPDFDRMLAELSVKGHGVPMTRRISPCRDLVSLFRLIRLLRQQRPHIAHGHTPKGGFLTMLAAALCRVPIRIYHLRGLRFTTIKGAKRHLLKLVEKIACLLAHRVIAVSRSLADEAIWEGICAAGKVKVLANGSGNGVDALRRFNPANVDAGARARVRHKYGIPVEAIVIGYVGRIVKDKGIRELVDAWRIVSAERPDAHLLVVGRFQAEDPVSDDVMEALQTGERIHLAGRVANMPEVYRAIDLLLLPTYREGLGNVLLEAAAMEIPVVASRVTGCVDAILDGTTGVLVPPRDAEALAEATLRYIQDRDLRVRHGQAGRAWVLEKFRPEDVWEALRKEYDSLVTKRIEGRQ